MIPLNYHHLYYFWTVARAGTISSAGEELLLAQSTLSLQLQELERSLGRKLLYRGRKGVSLTPEGKSAFEYCEQIFSRGQALLSSFKEGGNPASVLRIGAEESVSRHIVLSVLAFVRRLKQDVRIWISSGTQGDIQDRLQRHLLDLAVSGVDFSFQLGSDFQSRLVASIPLFLVGTPGIKRRVRRFPGDLAGVPILVRTPENPVRKSVDQFLRRHKITPEIAAEVEDVELLRILALDGQGAAFLDGLTIQEDLHRGRLVKLRKESLGGHESVWFIARGRADSSSPLHRVIQSLMVRFSALGKSLN